MLIIKLPEDKVFIDPETQLPSISILDIPEFTERIDIKTPLFEVDDTFFKEKR